jgi:hypothetical protein
VQDVAGLAASILREPAGQQQDMELGWAAWQYESVVKLLLWMPTLSAAMMHCNDGDFCQVHVMHGSCASL